MQLDNVSFLLNFRTNPILKHELLQERVWRSFARSQSSLQKRERERERESERLRKRKTAPRS